MPGQPGAQRLQPLQQLFRHTFVGDGHSDAALALHLLRAAHPFAPVAELPVACHQRPRLGREGKPAIARHVDGKESAAHQLPDHGLPLGARTILADAEDRVIDVAEGHRLLVGLAGQHVGDMARAEALAGDTHRLEDLPRLHRPVDEIGGVRQTSQLPQGPDSSPK